MRYWCVVRSREIVYSVSCFESNRLCVLLVIIRMSFFTLGFSGFFVYAVLMRGSFAGDCVLR